MDDLHEARFYVAETDGSVLCTLCPHDCHIPAGAREINPIEKKPLFHFYPGSFAYSIATVGCSLRCRFCQNWDIAQWPKTHLPKHLVGEKGGAPAPICPQLAMLDRGIPGESVTPKALVAAAKASGCLSLSYTFTEPTIFYELAYDTAKLACQQGLKNTFISNGYINEAPQRELATVLDAANIDLKFFTEQGYRHTSRARLAPVLAAIKRYHELGVWLEVTTLIIPGLNDSDRELRQIAEFIYAIGPEIPWHVTRFYPAYQMRDIPPTEVASLRRAREIGLAAGLRYVYEGNVPGEGGENTYCYHCQSLLIERIGFVVRVNAIRNGCCPKCGSKIDGVGMSADIANEHALEDNPSDSTHAD